MTKAVYVHDHVNVYVNVDVVVDVIGFCSFGCGNAAPWISVSSVSPWLSFCSGQLSKAERTPGKSRNFLCPMPGFRGPAADDDHSRKSERHNLGQIDIARKIGKR